jgi:hypothetical protein
MKSIVIKIAAVLLLAANTAFSWDRDKNSISYRIETGSRLWIEGSATLGSYECRTVAIYGTGDVDTSRLNNNFHSAADNSGKSAQLDVLVKFFDCGNNRMNADMYHALKADKDSTIHYKLIRSAILYDSTAVNGRFGLRTVGVLLIAGVAKIDTIDVDVVSLQDNKFELIGKKHLSMIDFSITPPTAFFGLIKAHEDLTVNFDLIAVPSDEMDTDNKSVIFGKY